MSAVELDVLGAANNQSKSSQFLSQAQLEDDPAKSSNVAQCKKILETHGKEKLFSGLVDTIRTNGDYMKYLRGLCNILNLSGESRTKASLYKFYSGSVLATTIADEDACNKMTSFLLSDLDELQLSPKHIRTLIHVFIKDCAIVGSQGRSATLLSSFLERMWIAPPFSGVVALPVEGAADAQQHQQPQEITGPQVVAIEVQQLCNRTWSTESTEALVSALADFPRLQKPQIDIVIEKAFLEMRRAPLATIPAIVHHCLLLSGRGDMQSKEKFLAGLLGAFEYMERYGVQGGTKEQLFQVQGNVILQVNFAVKQDMALGKRLQKALMPRTFITLSPLSASLRLTPDDPPAVCLLSGFGIGLLMSVARIGRHTDAVIDGVRKAIDAHWRAVNRIEAAPVGELKQLQLPVLRDRSPAAALWRLVELSGYGWEQVVPSLVSLAVLMLDSAAGKRAKNDHAAAMSASTARLVLEGLFERHESVRGEILDQIFSRVITNADGVHQYARLLRSLVRRSPMLVASSSLLAKCRDCVSYLSTIPSDVGETLVTSLLELLPFQPAFRDDLMLVLRKCLFSRDIEARISAVRGLLHMLHALQRERVALIDAAERAGKNAAAAGAASPLVEQIRHIDSASFEVINCLARALGQQSDVRRELYQGFAAIVWPPASASVISHIADVLYRQLLAYYVPASISNATDADADAADSDDVADSQRRRSPIDVNKCFDEDNCASETVPPLVEPLADLIASARACLLAVNDALETAGDSLRDPVDPTPATEAKSVVLLGELLGNIAQRLVQCTAADFDFDEATKFEKSSVVGEHNRNRAALVVQLLGSVVDNFISLCTMDELMEKMTSVMRLHEVHESVMKLVQTGGIIREGDFEDGAAPAPSKKKRSRGAASDTGDRSILARLGGKQFGGLSASFHVITLRLLRESGSSQKERAQLNEGDEAAAVPLSNSDGGVFSKKLREQRSLRRHMLSSLILLLKSLHKDRSDTVRQLPPYSHVPSLHKFSGGDTSTFNLLFSPDNVRFGGAYAQLDEAEVVLGKSRSEADLACNQASTLPDSCQSPSRFGQGESPFLFCFSVAPLLFREALHCYQHSTDSKVDKDGQSIASLALSAFQSAVTYVLDTPGVSLNEMREFLDECIFYVARANSDADHKFAVARKDAPAAFDVLHQGACIRRHWAGFQQIIERFVASGLRNEAEITLGVLDRLVHYGGGSLLCASVSGEKSVAKDLRKFMQWLDTFCRNDRAASTGIVRVVMPLYFYVATCATTKDQKVLLEIARDIARVTGKPYDENEGDAEQHGNNEAEDEDNVVTYSVVNKKTVELVQRVVIEHVEWLLDIVDGSFEIIRLERDMLRNSRLITGDTGSSATSAAKGGKPDVAMKENEAGNGAPSVENDTDSKSVRDNTTSLSTISLLPLETGTQASVTFSEHRIDDLFIRLHRAEAFMHRLLRSTLPIPLCDRLLKVLRQLYEVITRILKELLSEQHPVQSAMKRVVTNCGKYLTPDVRVWMNHMCAGGAHDSNAAGAKKKQKNSSKRAGARSVKSEGTAVPALVEAMEKLEVLLIQYGKQIGDELFEEFVEEATNVRIFHVSNDAVHALQDAADDEEDDDDDEVDEAEDAAKEKETPAKKKRKTGSGGGVEPSR